jgi:hypothetical protein
VCTEEHWSHVVKYDETACWRGKLADGKLARIEAEIGSEGQLQLKIMTLQKVGLCLRKYKDKW